jgi:hypothetical protein
MERKEVEEILKNGNRLLKTEAEKFLDQLIKDLIDREYSSKKKFEYATKYYIFGFDGVIKENITSDDIIQFLTKLAKKKFLGTFFDYDYTFSKKDLERHTMDLLGKL